MTRTRRRRRRRRRTLIAGNDRLRRRGGRWAGRGARLGSPVSAVSLRARLRWHGVDAWSRGVAARRPEYLAGTGVEDLEILASSPSLTSLADSLPRSGPREWRIEREREDERGRERERESTDANNAYTGALQPTNRNKNTALRGCGVENKMALGLNRFSGFQTILQGIESNRKFRYFPHLKLLGTQKHSLMKHPNNSARAEYSFESCLLADIPQHLSFKERPFEAIHVSNKCLSFMQSGFSFNRENMIVEKSSPPCLIKSNVHESDFQGESDTGTRNFVLLTGDGCKNAGNSHKDFQSIQVRGFDRKLSIHIRFRTVMKCQIQL